MKMRMICRTPLFFLALAGAGLLLAGDPATAGLDRIGWGWAGGDALDLIDEKAPEDPEFYRGPWDLEAKPHPLFVQAEKEFKKKNFRQAERGYARFIKNAGKHIDVPEATFQRARALFKLSSFDEARDLLEEFLSSRPGLLFEARCRRVVSELYSLMPAYAFRRGMKLHYNREHREGRQIYVWVYNQFRTVRELETARLAYMALVGRAPTDAGARSGTDLLEESLQNSFSLALRLRSGGGQLWDGFGEQDIQPPARDARYDFSWPERSKILFLYEESDRLASGREHHRLMAEARFQKAVFLMGFPEAAPVPWQKQARMRLEECNQKRQNGDPVCRQDIHDPGPRFDPLSLLESIFRDCPSCPDLDRALGTIARCQEGRGELLKAESTYEALLEKYPRSKYAGDARQSLHELRREWFSAHSDTVFTPDKKKEISLSARNVKSITFQAYEVDLRAALASSSALTSPRRRFADFASNFKGTKNARKWFGRKVASWHFEPNDRGDRVMTAGTSDMPLDQTGAYLVLAKGGKEEHVMLVVLTDLVVVGKQDRGKAHFWVTEAVGGQPVPGAEVVVKETYWMGSAERVRIGRYRSDESGRLTHGLVEYRMASSSNVQAFAHRGKRFAFSQTRYCYSRGQNQLWDQNRIFTITDRPVYRPGDTIRFKHIVRGYHRGKNANVPGVRLRVQVTNPRGEKLYDQTHKTDEYGSLHGDVQLDTEAALGVYRVHAWVEKGYGSYQSSGSTFRVEEYKKPEFKVTVTPAVPEARLGTAVKAEIAARTYFGTAVAHARVRYQVYRQPTWQTYYPPTRWDWLFGSGYGIVDERPFEQGVGNELVLQGDGQADEQGILRIELPPAEKDSKFDYLYTIQAQVTDLSRRTIQGKGEVKVTRDPFHIFTRTPAGFYSPGDRIELEINARTPQDKPVQAAGSWTVHRLTYPIGEQEKAEKLVSGPVRTNAAGRAFVPWTAPEEGQFRVTVSLRQGKGPEVERDHLLYVTTDRFDPGRFRFRKITLTTEKRTYLRGETIRLMVGVPEPNAVIWLSQEGGDEIFSEQVIRLQGTGAVLEIPADETRAPNFFVRVAFVEGGEVYFAQREVFIPPGEEILEVALEPDAATRTPGEKGLFHVKVLDHRGRPVQGQLCLAVFDESVLYIQGDTTGDIRSYYYGERRYLQLWADSSLQIYHLGAHWSPRYPKFKLGGLPGAGSTYDPMFLAIDGTGIGTYGYGRGGGGHLGNVHFRGGAHRLSLQTRGDFDARDVTVTGALSAGEGSFADELARGPVYKSGGRAAESAGPAPVTLREHFADTALWLPAIETDSHGRAKAELTYPDSTTTWKGRVFVVDKGRRVGMATARVITTKNLVARIETPRFLVEGDRLTLAAVIHNGFDQPLDVDVRLHLDGLEIASSPELRLTIPARSDMRHDFAAIARRPGEARVRLTARSARESDALVKTLPVVEWGSEKMVATGDTLKQAGSLDLSLRLPEKRKRGSARLTVEASPSMGGVLLRALPYLLRYPYGCVEQTISRFVPAAVVARTLANAGVSLEQLKPVRGKSDLARPLGKLPWYSAIRTSGELQDIIRRSLSRLASMQNPDGGFGWFSGFESDPYMTAYAVLGLHEAKSAGHAVDATMLQRAVDSLHAQADDLKASHLGVFVAYVVGLEGRPMPDLIARAYRIRDKLSPYGQSLLALALHQAGMKSRARRVVENLADLAWVDEANQTATFKPPPTRWWLWWFNRVETTSWALRAFLSIDPRHPQVDRFAKWLTRNRTGNRWTSTRDTAMAVLALTDYMKQRGELNPDGRITIRVNGRRVKSFRSTRKTVLGLEGTVVIPDEALASGPVEVKVELQGRGVVYASAFLEYFTQEDRIEGAGHEIAVSRTYHRLTPVTRKKKTWRGEIQVREYETSPLGDGATVHSGDLVEVRIAVDSRNDYSHLIFEDFKPAGFEPVELKSGCLYAHGSWQYRELRDEKVVHFLSGLPQGTQVMTYQLRAEIPGTFRVLPHKAQAMYAPRIRAISDSSGMVVTD